MRSARFLLLLAGVTLLASCDDEGDVVNAPPVSLAYTRFVHAVPDTGATDWRFIDQLDYSPIGLGLTFRQFSPYQGTEAGSRHLRIFPRSIDPNLTSQHLVDATITFEAGQYYTLVHVGYSRTGQTPEDQLVVIQDAIPASIAATDVALRTMNLATGLANPDIYALATTTTPIAGTPTFANVAFAAATPYVTRPTGAFALRATPAGQVTPVTASATAPAGEAANPVANLTAIGGSTIGGSAILGILTPRSVAGSAAPQTTAFTNPAWVYMIDRHPR
jgi:hypothetical protein